MKNNILFLLIICLFVCVACNAPASTPTPAPATTVPSPTNTPTVTTTAVPTPLRPSFEGWEIEDNGIDGIGTIRGNTNGNYATGGRAVETEDTIYYINTEQSDTFFSEYTDLVVPITTKRIRLLAYSKQTGTEKVLLDGEQNIGHLNWDGAVLWFLRSYMEVCTFDPNSGEVKVVYNDRAPYDLLIAYNLILIGVRGENQRDTVCLDINTHEEIQTHERFGLLSAMDGWLYGADYFPDDKPYFYKMRPDGTEKKKSTPVTIAANGYLYYYELFGYYGPGARKLQVTNIESGKTKTLKTSDLLISSMNVSHDLLYLLEYETNKIYTMNLDGTNLTLMTKWTQRWGSLGPTMLSSGLANFIVPSDPIPTETGDGATSYRN